ncbi:VOC family protein [Nocardia mexicana]|uniref:Glyoxalase/bleomycin resistance protein/dioxygenase superfamily protein n=1 Tax=Nocardia mexicana TaxID=279262 RepID=A0A370HD36_9NOCA|nr:VOC family protein [Nocardia mexicana]RDI54411.1 glyoxalase/bleomycin resistance protein/dioxygenase superfamily protein [Nocardia mexicana]
MVDLESRVSLAGESITQIAWVVADVEAAEGFLGTCFGIRAWSRMPDVRFGPDSCTYRGEPADFTAHISLSYRGDMQLELIQPVRGASIYTEFLERSGPGLHHICTEPEDFDRALRDAATRGIEVVQQGDMAGQMRFAYLDGAAAGVPFVELAEIGPHMRALFEQIRRAA